MATPTQTDAGLRIGRRLRTWYRERGFPREAVALATSRSSDSVRLLEQGRSRLTAADLLAIAQLAGVSISDLADELLGPEQSRLNANEVYRRRPARRGGPVLAAVGS